MNYHKIVCPIGWIVCWTGIVIQTDLMAADPSVKTAPWNRVSASALESNYDTLPGIVEPFRQVDVSAPFAGMVKEIRVKEGDRIQEGQLLFTMDDRIAAAELELARAVENKGAGIENAKATLDHAGAMLKRLERVAIQRAVSESEVERAKLEVSQAESFLKASESEMNVLRAKRELARVRFEMHAIHSPLQGHVVRVDAHQGETVVESAPLVSVVDTRFLRVELQVPIRHYEQLSIGKSYGLDSGPPVSRTIKAKLSSFEPIVDTATQTFRCVFLIDNQASRYPAGFTAELAEKFSD